MASPKIPRLQRLEIRREIARLSAFGYTQDMIRERIRRKYGHSLSESSICYHQARIRDEHLKAMAESREELVARKLAELYELRRTAFEAYERSLESTVKQVATKDGGVVELVSDGTPSASMLGIIRDTYLTEIDLLGLEAPKRQEVASKILTVDWGAMLASPNGGGEDGSSDPAPKSLGAAAPKGPPWLAGGRSGMPTPDEIGERLEQLRGLPDAEEPPVGENVPGEKEKER